MQILEEKLRAPELRVSDWLNSPPLTMAGLRGRVVLIDFWDATCINCLHTLPYLKEWHARYAEAGLTVIGIHAPEFAFSRDAKVVETALQRFNLTYPVALDNEFRTWNAFANRAWPTKYLVDTHGYIRACHRGEGEYQAFERAIQDLLHEADPAQRLPEPIAPIRDIDRPGAACYRATPELYLGYGRGVLANPESPLPEHVVDYAPLSDPQPSDSVALTGAWLNTKEFVESASDRPVSIHVNYRAAGVNLVMAPGADGPVTVRLLLDDEPLPEDLRGEDTALLDGWPVTVVDSPRMYALVRHPDFAVHRLTLAVSAPGLRAYAFTFITCVA
ncbi:MAG TPA: redoxin domain-containing protein [Coleofasciculaceae cyanobacterium]|jgi:thiol-disulfide isomerase/thioredoxin